MQVTSIGHPSLSMRCSAHLLLANRKGSEYRGGGTLTRALNVSWPYMSMHANPQAYHTHHTCAVHHGTILSMPSVPRLEDCLLVVTQLLHALLDVCHGCVKGLHIKALRYRQSAETPNETQQSSRGSDQPKAM
jgi:hypothetical protein